jgi:hypothetical protein
VERLEEDLPGQWTPKKEGVEIFITDKVHFKLTLIKQDKGGHSILIKGVIHQKEITIINLYAPIVSEPNFVKHTLKDLKAFVDSSTVVVGDFNTHLSPIDRSSKQKINKEILELNHIMIKLTMLMSKEYFIHLLPNIQSSQQPMETSSKLLIS